MPEIAEAQALLAALAETDEVKARSGAAAATDAVARRLRQRAHRGARLSARRKRRKPSPEPASRRLATRTRPNGWRPTTAYGSAATCEASCRRCGRTRRPSSATSRRDPIRPRPASRIASPGSPTGSPESIAKRGIIWNARSPCSNPAATTIWPFASDRTPASRAMVYLAIASWPLGEVDRAISLVDAHADADRGPHPCRHARVWENARGHVRIDARRPCARRAERVRTRPPRARARPAHVARVRRVSRGLGDGCERRARRAGSRTCAAASSSCANRTFCCSTGS